jgi:hypothetical protein
MAPAVAEATIRSPGHPLPKPVRNDMEPRLRHDFSRVRVHTDSQAQQAARAVSARAFTIGQHVVFGEGEYQPDTVGGRALIAHELTHTVQQADARAGGWPPLTIGAADDRQEREASSVEGGVLAERATPMVIGPGPLTLALAPQRTPARRLSCNERQRALVDEARRTGAIRCQVAAFRTKGIVAPGPPELGDPGLASRWEAQAVADRIFGERLNMEQVGDIVTGMGARLAASDLPVECAPSSDPECGSRSGYVVGYRPPIYLCPPFFRASGEERIRTLVHEAAHLARIGEPRGESYCPVFDCASPCGGFSTADAWSHYVHCVSGRTPDQPEVIGGGKR